MFALVAIVICVLSSAVFSHQSCYSKFDYECYVLGKLVEHMDAISSIKEDLEGIVSGDTKCPDAWTAFQGSCYLFGNQKMTFNDAETFCEQSGAHLVHIDDTQENNFILEMVGRFHTQNWWIGLTDGVIEGNWKFAGTDISPAYTNWYPGQPESNGGRTNEDCATLYHKVSFKWVDISCTTSWQPICEKWFVHILND
ncbi:perlucin-like protein [Mercenaria mercenaria]|uniref:perlucin-like protein n=1 Tax=Mercenaria mercenaria TaxID=6596 RepID=UPI00234E8870|nr:perlucin-like protein [Mercenaria mercenaria]